MNNISAKQLRYFLAVAKHKNFQKAADDLNISQPALSMKIKEMEVTLGQLIERGSKKFYLTQTGLTLISKAETIIQSFDDLKHLAANEGKINQLSIGAIPTVAPYLLPKILKTISKQYKDIIIEPKEAVTEKLVSYLISGKIDLAILALPTFEPLLSEALLFEEEFLLIRHINDAKKPVPNNKELTNMKLLLLEEGHCLRSQTLSFCKVTSVPKNIMEGTTLTTLVQMVSAGIGVTLIPEIAVPFETRSAKVSISKFQQQKPKRTIGLVWRKSNPLLRQFNEIATLLKNLNQIK
ncbi:LysR substrate-binding domain-containing protein [Pelagibacteraceae bacterium]|nr:LysR substrate-binding domain-containing protein [Pelagibacteraceae bacterium]|tara:strand:+ start:214 stop:1095 length:882 start_codon:yes stop_codon:yes gene_type:complete